MMRDMTYAGFAQLSYLDWHNLNEDLIQKLGDRSLKTLLNNKDSFRKIKNKNYDDWDADENYCVKVKNSKRIYDKKDARIIYLYSEDSVLAEKNPKFSEFDQWEFLCAYDHKKIREEAGNVVSRFDSGFQASAFKKDNQVMIAYRGTDEAKDWTRANFSIGTNNVAEQFICAVWFYDKVLDLVGESVDIHISGHSLGGCLAQFAFIYSGCEHSTKTWNGLGVGSKDKNVSLYPLHMDEVHLRRVLQKLGFLDNKTWTAKCETASLDDIKEISKQYIATYSKGNRLKSELRDFDKFKEFDHDGYAVRIAINLKTVYLYESNYDKARNNKNLQNMYFSGDLTPNLQKREGIITEVDKDFDKVKMDKGSSGIFRKIEMLSSKVLAAYHSVTNFLIFTNDDGNIVQGEIRDFHMKNVYKTLLMSKEMPKDDIERVIKKGDVTHPAIYALLDDVYKAKDEIVNTRHFDWTEASYNAKKWRKTALTLKKMLLDIQKELQEYQTDTKAWFEKDDQDAYLGKFSNLEELAGVKYGAPNIFKLLDKS